jgi:hypothetical protein
MTIPRFMNSSTAFRAYAAMSGAAVFALGCFLGLSTVLVPPARAGEGGAELRRLDNSLPALPLSTNFEKEDGDNGPFGLTLKNTSGDPIKASGVVTLNLGTDAISKTRQIPEHTIERAETWTVYGLSTGDKVTIVADGFAPLAVTVP